MLKAIKIVFCWDNDQNIQEETDERRGKRTAIQYVVGKQQK